MWQKALSYIKAQVPVKLKDSLKIALTDVVAFLTYPRNKIIWLRARSQRMRYQNKHISSEQNYRIYDYNYSLLPNAYLSTIEETNTDADSIARTGHTIGYPSWNLLYYTLLCSLPTQNRDVVIIETGTNYGFSTIIMAQLLKDMKMSGVIRTVDIDENTVSLAKDHVAQAGLTDYVEFHAQDSTQYLASLVHELDYIDFAFLDGSHEYSDVTKEFSLIYPLIVACKGKVFFDNTNAGGVARALQYIKYAYGGHFIEFQRWSSSPPGNVIWQPE